MSTASRHDWILWQLADSAFPTGGFAHSGGLEAAFQHRELRRVDDVVEFLTAALHQAGHSSVPFVAAAFADLHLFPVIDGHCDAFTSNHVANRASRLQGRAFLNSAHRAFPEAGIARFIQQNAPLHFAPAFGAVAHLLELDRTGTLRLFLFTQLRGWISSAVRLGVVGPLEAQRIQAQLSTHAENILEACLHLTVQDVAQTAPLIDLFQGSQDRLYSRLFQS